MTPSSLRPLAAEAIERLARDATDSRAFRSEVLARLRQVVEFDWYVWVLTDPVTGVGVDPIAEIPDLRVLPATVRLKYLTPINRWTSLETAAALGSRAAESPLWREVQRNHGVVDVASVVLRDRFGCWGFLDLWSTQPYAADDVALLRDHAPGLTKAVRLSRAHSFTPPTRSEPSPAQSGVEHSDRVGTVVLLLDEALTIVGQTAGTDNWLRLLLPQPDGTRPIPACAYNVAAQLLAREAGIDDHEAMARMPLPDGSWVTLRATRMDPDSRIAVTIGRSSADDRLDVFARAHGLTERERLVVSLIAQGADTAEAAARLFLSPHTIQDQLKSAFGKTGTHSRRALLSVAIGAQDRAGHRN